MSAGPHKAVLPACLLLCAVGACVALPPWLGAEDIALLTLAREVCRGEALGQRSRAAWGALTGKIEALDDLTAGRLSLREGAERFGRLNARRDGSDGLLGACGEEPLCRHVLYWVEVECGRRPGLAPALARLEEEYRGLFGRDPSPWPALTP
jgi:hypothetical protein